MGTELSKSRAKDPELSSEVREKPGEGSGAPRAPAESGGLVANDTAQF